MPNVFVNAIWLKPSSYICTEVGLSNILLHLKYEKCNSQSPKQGSEIFKI